MKTRHLPPLTDLVFPLLIFVFFFSLFFITHDRLYIFDAVLSAGVIEQPLLQQDLQHTVFGMGRFLWHPTGRLFYLITEALGMNLTGYQALQIFNSLIGAIMLVIVFVVMHKRSSLLWALFTIGIIGFSFTFWSRSASGMYHLFAGFWAFITTLLAAEYWQKPSRSLAFLMGVTTMFALYFHLANLILWFPVFALVISRRDKNLLKDISIVAGIFILTVSFYGFIHQFFREGGFTEWWLWATKLSRGIDRNHYPVTGFQLTILTDPLRSINTLLFCYWFLDGVFPIWIRLGGMLLLGFVAYKIVRLKKDPFLKTLLFFFSTFFIFFSIWSPEDYTYWSGVLTIFGIMTSLVFYHHVKSIEKPIKFVLMGSLAFMLYVNNLTGAIRPRTTSGSVMKEILFCNEIQQLTPAQSPILIGGGLYKVYIPYFAGRERISLELIALNAKARNQNPFDDLQNALIYYLNRGIPIYVTQGFMDIPSTHPNLGISKDEINSFLDPFKLIRVSEELYLMWTNRISEPQRNNMCRLLIISGFSDQCRRAQN